jgi:hypothetical protein
MGFLGRARFWKILILLMLLLPVAGVVGTFLLFSHRVRQQEAMLAAADFLNTFAAVGMPVLAPGENGAELYRQAARQLAPAPNQQQAQWPELDCSVGGVALPEPDPAYLASLADAATRNQSALQDALRAQALPASVFGAYDAPNVAPESIVPLNDYGLVRSLSLAFRDEALLAMAQGNREAAYQWTLANLRLANDLQHENLLIGLLVRVVVARVALDTLQEAAKRVGDAGDVREALLGELHQLHDAGALTRILLGEFLLSRKLMGVHSYKGAFERLTAAPMQYQYAEMMLRVIEASRLDAGERDAMLEAMENAVELSMGFSYPKMMLPPLRRTMLQFDELRQDVAAEEVALRLEEHRSEQGGYPDTLEAVGLAHAGRHGGRSSSMCAETPAGT